MDRDTVRIIVLIIGVLVLAGIYIWGRYKRKILGILERRGASGAPVFEVVRDIEEEEAWSELEESYNFGAEAASQRAGETFSEADAQMTDADAIRDESVAKTAGTLGAPFLIQLSVVKVGGARFPGESLRDALIDLDLVYGEMGIFHRYDNEYREPLFSVASLVEPGTFPVNDMENFRCPGVVFFFQPGKVPNPLEVFDDLVDTCRALATTLGGAVWDQNRAELTEARAVQMRERLAEACEQP